MRKVLSMIFVAGMLVAGCAEKQPVVENEVVIDPADTALSRAASEIQRDLRMLAESEHGTPYIGEPQSLSKTAKYRFTGEIEDLVRDVGRNIGYNTEFSGKPPSQAIMVTIHTNEPQTWFSILQSAGTQAGDRANITVNDVTRTVTLSYDGINNNIPKKPEIVQPARTQAERNNTVLQARGNSADAKARKALEKAQARAVTAQAKTAADMPQGIVVSPVNTPQIGQAPVQQPVMQPAAQPVTQPMVPQQGGAFNYKGSVLGAHKMLGQRLGYQLRIDGPASDIPVNISVPSGAWQDVANSINQQIRDASIFVDVGNKMVVLRFWR